MERSSGYEREHLRKGDVVYLAYPFIEAETEEDSKDRPAVILFEADVDTFTVCPITHQPNRKHKISIKGSDLKSGSLTSYEASYARPNCLYTVHRSKIRRKVGTLEANKLQEIIQKTKDLLDEPASEKAMPKALERAKRRIR